MAFCRIGHLYDLKWVIIIDCNKLFKTYLHENTTSRALGRLTWEDGLFQLPASGFTHLPCHVAPKEGKNYYCVFFALKRSVGPQRNQVFFFCSPPCLLPFSPEKALSNTRAEQGAGFPPAVHRNAPARPWTVNWTCALLAYLEIRVSIALLPDPRPNPLCWDEPEEGVTQCSLACLSARNKPTNSATLLSRKSHVCLGCVVLFCPSREKVWK